MRTGLLVEEQMFSIIAEGRAPKVFGVSPHRPNALRTHDRLASQAPRTHPTAEQLPLMRKTHG